VYGCVCVELYREGEPCVFVTVSDEPVDCWPGVPVGFITESNIPGASFVCVGSPKGAAGETSSSNINPTKYEPTLPIRSGTP
jgi:hypothetical protein